MTARVPRRRCGAPKRPAPVLRAFAGLIVPYPAYGEVEKRAARALG